MSIVNLKALKQLGCELWWPGQYASLNSPKLVTAVGGVTQTNEIADPWGGSRNVAKFASAGDYIALPTSQDWNVGSGDFAISAWVYPTSVNGAFHYIFGMRDSSGSDVIGLNIDNGNKFTAAVGNASDSLVNINGTSTVVANAWYYVVLTRTGSDFKLYVNDTLEVTVNSSIVINPDHVDTARIGVDGLFTGVSTQFFGYLSDFVFKKGTSSITTTFPPQPFKPDPYTKLLLHFDGVGQAFYDSSDPPGDNGFPILPDGVTVTPSGTFAVQKLKTGLNCYKFDGSTNYISLSDHDAWFFQNADFTICGWINLSVVTGIKVLCSQITSPQTYFEIVYNATGTKLSFTQYVTNVSKGSFYCTFAPTVNQQYFITIIRLSSTCKMYINCVDTPVTTSTAFADVSNLTGAFYIGYDTADFMNGNIKDLMIFKGNALSLDQLGAIMEETFIY